jgi:hypothetical protein
LFDVALLSDQLLLPCEESDQVEDTDAIFSQSVLTSGLSPHKITPLAVAELTVLLDIAPTAMMLPNVTTCAVDPSIATPFATLVA